MGAIDVLQGKSTRHCCAPRSLEYRRKKSNSLYKTHREANREMLSVVRYLRASGFGSSQI
jgi:hypothetical protein